MTKPTFNAKSEFARYVDEVNRLSGNRPAIATFLPDPPGEKPENNHLSVNSLEIETMDKIVKYHQWRQKNNDKVAVCIHKVYQYRDAGQINNVQITYDKNNSKWMFSQNGVKFEEAFRHRPVQAKDNWQESSSHCGVEFVRAFSEHEAAKFARRMTAKKFQLY